MLTDFFQNTKDFFTCGVPANPRALTHSRYTLLDVRLHSSTHRLQLARALCLLRELRLEPLHLRLQSLDFGSQRVGVQGGGGVLEQLVALPQLQRGGIGLALR